MDVEFMIPNNFEAKTKCVNVFLKGIALPFNNAFVK
jgi:hypothetical protein